MKTPTMLAQLCAVAVLAAPLGLLGAENDDTMAALKLTTYVAPEYPAGVRFEGGPTGGVTLAISRDATGVPTDVLVVESTNPKLTEAAVTAARQWRFEPAVGEAANAAVVVRVGFRLTGLVVVYPFGKDVADEASGTEPASVPRIQALPEAPKALNQPMPRYPVAMTSKGVEGTAAVKFYVDEDGRVRIPQVIEASNPEFAAAAIAAVSQWRYEPPRIGGRRIVASEHWAFKFATTN